MEPSHITILVADDEPNILLLAKMLFQEMGITVITASDGEEAIHKALTENIDLLITDVMMPKKTGFDVCRAIRATPEKANMPIILLSAMGDEYNKISGFDGGADDYVTKPFSVEELKARAKALLHRHQGLHANAPTSFVESHPLIFPQEDLQELGIGLISTGIDVLDQALFGGLPRGSNILVLGPIGYGKSSFAREFIRRGLQDGERNLFVALDDNPALIRSHIQGGLACDIGDYEQSGLLRFVDAYSWSAMSASEEEAFKITGMLELNQLSGCIADASFELGQTIQSKVGGRRVLDSISSLLVNFDLPSVQRFLSQVARTAVACGGVTTLFLLEEGTVSEQVLNNVRYIMDGTIEFSEQHTKRHVRVASMKWSRYSNKWQSLD